MTWQAMLGLALANSLVVPVQGVMTDADGIPLEGTHVVTVSLWRGAPGELSPVATTTSSVSFDAGLFRHLVAVDDSAAADGPVAEWVTVDLAGVASSPVQVGYAPNAVYASSAGAISGQSLDDLDARYARVDGSSGMTIGSVTVTDLTPDAPGTLVPRSFLETTIAAYLPLTGGTITGDLGVDGALTLGGDPIAALQAATKGYVDAAAAPLLSRAGGTMTGALVLAGAPTAANEAATKAYIDAALTPFLSAATAASTYLPLAGGTLTGALTLSGAPTASGHAATKGYVDTSLSPYLTTANAGTTYLAKAGGTMTGALTLAGAPSGANDAATKAYVDSKVTTVGTIPEIFTYFGDDACPSGTTLIYSGIGFAAHYTHAGGSTDWSCIAPNDATAPQASGGTSFQQAYIYPMSVESASYYPSGTTSFKRLRCSVCQVDTGPCFTYWGDDVCPSSFPRKLWGGYSVSAWHNHNARNRECVNLLGLDTTFTNSTASYGSIIYPENVQLEGLAQPGYTPDRLLQCARCCKQ